MKILFLGGNMAKGLADWLEQRGEEVIYKEERITIDNVKELSPEIIVSYNYKYIIPKQIIDCVGGKAINLHISLLPWNKGAHPNVRSFLEGIPKGVTIHYIDEGIDTGDIIVQKEVFIDEDEETFKGSYEILHKEIQTLFKENWDKIKSGEITPQPQVGGASTTRENLPNSNNLSGGKAGTYQSENSKNNITEVDLKLRNVESCDINDLFKWRNHPDVRKNSFNTNAISYDEHKTWFRERVKDQKCVMYMAYCSERKIGLIRFEDGEERVKTSVMLNPDYWGKGFSSKLIRLATEKFVSENKPNKQIIAEIKKDNVASIKAFQKAGFKESHVTFVFNVNRKTCD